MACCPAQSLRHRLRAGCKRTNRPPKRIRLDVGAVAVGFIKNRRRIRRTARKVANLLKRILSNFRSGNGFVASSCGLLCKGLDNLRNADFNDDGFLNSADADFFFLKANQRNQAHRVTPAATINSPKPAAL